MHIMGSPLCDDYNSGRSIVSSNSHLAKLILQCDEELQHSKENHELCNDCVLHTDQGFCLCQTYVSNANKRLNLFNDFKNNLGCFLPSNLALDSYSSLSSPLSFIDRHLGFPFVSSPPNNGDSSSLSSSGFFQNFDNYTNNQTQVPMLHPLDISKDSSCSGFDNFDGYNYLPGKDLILTDFIDEIPRNIAETPTEILSSPSSGMSSSVPKDYSIEALANASSQDYNKNQKMIGSSKANEQTNNLGIFPNNSLVQLDYGTSQLILTDEMLPSEDHTFLSKLQARQEALIRYFAKKKKRKFGKQIRYESRKSTADTKRRMKGRFTKAGADYDFDPRAKL